MTILSVTGNVFLPQEIFSLTGNLFLWQDIFSSERNFFLWQTILSSEEKDHPSTGSIFLWQEISSCDRKFPPATVNFFLCEEIYSCDRKYLSLTQKFSLRQEICFCGTKFNISSSWYKIATKVRDFCSKPHLRVQGFLSRLLAPWPRAGKRGAARQQCCQKEIDMTISGRRILVNYIIFVIFLTDND